MALTQLDMPMLTDDEIVAVSARLDAPWRTLLPTVGLDHPEAVTAAILRGSRSLYVRGLLDAETDELDPNLLGLMQKVGAKPVRLAAYASQENGDAVIGVPAQYFFAEQGDIIWLVDSISGGGVHTFGTDTASDVAAELRTAIRHVLSVGVQLPPGGPGAEGRTVTMTMISQHPDEVRQLVVGAQDSITANLIRDGKTTNSPRPPLTADDAVAWLLDV